MGQMNVIITGKNGWIATKLDDKLTEAGFNVTRISVRGDDWKALSFSDADALIHCASIVHRKSDSVSAEEYTHVNALLTEQLAQKALADGVKHFLFFSSIGVYGLIEGTITKELTEAPKNLYSSSKLDAEKRLCALAGKGMTISILRPPMSYGIDGRGNCARLEALADKLPFFPDYPNRRSLVSIEELCNFTQKVLENPENGIFFPRDANTISTTELVRRLRVGKRGLHYTKLFNPAIRLLLRSNNTTIIKMFGELCFQDGFPEQLPLPAQAAPEIASERISPE